MTADDSAPRPQIRKSDSQPKEPLRFHKNAFTFIWPQVPVDKPKPIYRDNGIDPDWTPPEAA
jgi:hypothetical protein